MLAGRGDIKQDITENGSIINLINDNATHLSGPVELSIFPMFLALRLLFDLDEPAWRPAW